MTDQELFEKRRDVLDSITISLHCSSERMSEYGLCDEDVREAIEKGKLYLEKCERPDKLGIVYYDGKKKESIVVIAKILTDTIKVVTVWIEKGRR